MTTIAPTIAWTASDNEHRVIQHASGKYYPQRLYIGVNGLDWQYEPEYRGYKTLASAKKVYAYLSK